MGKKKPLDKTLGLSSSGVLLNNYCAAGGGPTATPCPLAFVPLRKGDSLQPKRRLRRRQARVGGAADRNLLGEERSVGYATPEAIGVGSQESVPTPERQAVFSQAGNLDLVLGIDEPYRSGVIRKRDRSSRIAAKNCFRLHPERQRLSGLDIVTSPYEIDLGPSDFDPGVFLRIYWPPVREKLEFGRIGPLLLQTPGGGQCDHKARGFPGSHDGSNRYPRKVCEHLLPICQAHGVSGRVSEAEQNELLIGSGADHGRCNHDHRGIRLGGSSEVVAAGGEAGEGERNCEEHAAGHHVKLLDGDTRWTCNCYNYTPKMLFCQDNLAQITFRLQRVEKESSIGTWKLK